MYSFILEGRISNLPPIVNNKGQDMFWRIAASNTEKDYSNVNTTSLALLSRFCHLEVEPELDEIVNYLLENNNDSRIVGYLKNFPTDLFPQVFDEKLLDQKANPFPRQWENASHLISDIKTLGGKEDYLLLAELVSSCVGEHVGTRFVAWVKTTGKINMEKLMKEPKKEIGKIKDDSQKASLFYSIISNLAAFWFKRDKRLSPEKVVEITKELPAEFGVSFLKLILKKRTSELTVLNEFDKLLDGLGIYFDEQ